MSAWQILLELGSRKSLNCSLPEFIPYFWAEPWLTKCTPSVDVCIVKKFIDLSPLANPISRLEIDFSCPKFSDWKTFTCCWPRRSRIITSSIPIVESIDNRVWNVIITVRNSCNLEFIFSTAWCLWAYRLTANRIPLNVCNVVNDVYWLFGKTACTSICHIPKRSWNLNYTWTYLLERLEIKRCPRHSRW